MPFAINVWKLMENTGAFSANSKNQVNINVSFHILSESVDD